jgi:hypothetical protein
LHKIPPHRTVLPERPEGCLKGIVAHEFRCFAKRMATAQMQVNENAANGD